LYLLGNARRGHVECFDLNEREKDAIVAQDSKSHRTQI